MFIYVGKKLFTRSNEPWKETQGKIPSAIKQGGNKQKVSFFFNNSVYLQEDLVCRALYNEKKKKNNDLLSIIDSFSTICEIIGH